MSTTTGSSSSTIVESHNWLDLPDDVTAIILVKLGAVEIMETVQFVCVSWWRICKNSSMWQRIRMTNPDLTCTKYSYFRKMCREVVNRSDGQLIDISIEYFCDDELLQYIIERSSGLKRLRLLACFGIKEFTKAAAKLPMLEELVIKFYRLSTKELEEIGKSCCQLKSLKLDIEAPIPFLNPNYPCDEQALVIAENMPGLRHLKLVGNQLTDNGLRAIFNGCPHLESLDLRHCTNVRVETYTRITVLLMLKKLTVDLDMEKDVNDFIEAMMP